MNLFQATPSWPYHISCGGVVYKNARQPEVLLLKTRFKDDFPWHLPKGTLEPGERLEQAALRETEEEAGVVAEIEAYLGASHYLIPKEVQGYPFDKTVHYFVMRFVEDHPDGMDYEHDHRRWFPIDEAIKALHGPLKSEEEIMQRAKIWLGQHGA